MRHLAWKQVAWLLALAGIVRLGAAVFWHLHWHGQFVFGDSAGYFELARAIAHGQPYQLATGEQVFRAPGYPLLLAPVLCLWDGPAAIWAARIESCLFGSLTVLAVAYWAGQIFGPRAATIAGLIMAIYPEAVAISVPVLSEAPFCLLVAVNMILWTAAWLGREQGATQRVPGREQGAASREGYVLALLAGATAGAATLVRPSWMLFLPFAVTCGLFYGQRRRQLLMAAVMFAGFTLVMLPWWVRNYRVCGHFVPTTLQVGASLYDAWNPRATGASDMRFVPEFGANLRAGDAAGAGGDSFEYRLDRRFRQAAWDWARTNPGRVAQLAAIKLLRIWNVWPNEPSFSAWPVRLAVLLTYLPLIVLAALGVRKAAAGTGTPMQYYIAGAGRWPGALCWLPAAYFSLLHMVFVSSIRYRQPAMLGLIVLAAGYLANLKKSEVNPDTEPLPFAPNA
jgi:4-amino-4-deoxy-L-arabinose transferase-like glycosyltransferase